MNIELLREYIVFSKSLNISTAAKDLFMSQSALSKHLKAIEDEVGVSLIDRSGDLSLTEAGKTFLEACSSINHTYNAALEKCHKQSRNSSKLSILKPCTVDLSERFVFSAYRHFKHSYPDIDTRLLQMGGYSVVENLMLGRVDIATHHNPRPDFPEYCKAAGLNLLPVFSDHVYLWAPVDSPLLKKEHLYLKDLIETPIHSPASKIYSDYHNWLNDLCSLRNFKPLVIYRNLDMYELMNESLTDGVMILTSETIVGDPAIVYRNDMNVRILDDEDILNTVYLAWLKNNGNPALKTFLQSTKENIYPEFNAPEVIGYL